MAPPRPALSVVLPRPGPRRPGGSGSRALPLPPHTLGLGRPPVRPALATASLGVRAGGAEAPVRLRDRRPPPLPCPALLGGQGAGLGGGAAPRERQVRGRPTQGQRAWGRDGAVPALPPARTEKGVRPGGDHALP